MLSADIINEILEEDAEDIKSEEDIERKEQEITEGFNRSIKRK